MDRNKAIESVNEIKELMERSSKFVSLSGMTAVLAGVYALAGAYVAGQLLRSEDNREATDNGCFTGFDCFNCYRLYLVLV